MEATLNLIGDGRGNVTSLNNLLRYILDSVKCGGKSMKFFESELMGCVVTVLDGLTPFPDGLIGGQSTCQTPRSDSRILPRVLESEMVTKIQADLT